MQDTNGWMKHGRGLRPVVHTGRLMMMMMTTMLMLKVNFLRKSPGAAGGKFFSQERLAIGHREQLAKPNHSHNVCQYCQPIQSAATLQDRGREGIADFETAGRSSKRKRDVPDLYGHCAATRMKPCIAAKPHEIF